MRRAIATASISLLVLAGIVTESSAQDKVGAKCTWASRDFSEGAVMDGQACLESGKWGPVAGSGGGTISGSLQILPGGFFIFRSPVADSPIMLKGNSADTLEKAR